jgi:tetrapyrrole methylase family protein/MazG family protein
MDKDPSIKATTLGEGISRLNTIVSKLRAPDGCPWDKIQTLETLKPCLIEECYELLDKMASTDTNGHLEELGDVLLQVAFQANIREEQGDFRFLDVLNTVCDKLVRRHPHVFGDIKLEDTSDVLQNWEKIKKSEGKDKPKSALAGVPANLPSLLKAQRTQSKAARSGYEPYPKAGSRQKLDSELKELDNLKASSADQDQIKKKFGDVLFALVAHARELDIDAETAIKLATDDFSKSFLDYEKKQNS